MSELLEILIYLKCGGLVTRVGIVLFNKLFWFSVSGLAEKDMSNGWLSVGSILQYAIVVCV